jgi:ABC-type multidrug transport system fused ATPase/permease subunit
MSTVRSADQIVVLAAGRIVETGTHPDLLTREGAYAHLYRMQSRGVESGDTAALS